VASNAHADGTLGLRPEHIALVRDTGLEARVDGIEYLGADSLITCRVAGRPVAVRVAGRVGLSRGDTTHLAWVRGAQHFFGSGGKRVDEENVSHATMLA
jgi:sn-glycerol 3-phosphate transport system ATP-binding protein